MACEKVQREAAARQHGVLKSTRLRVGVSNLRIPKHTACKITYRQIGNRFRVKSRLSVPKPQFVLCCLQQYTVVCLRHTSAHRKAAARQSALKSIQLRASVFEIFVPAKIRRFNDILASRVSNSVVEQMTQATGVPVFLYCLQQHTAVCLPCTSARRKAAARHCAL